MASSTSTVGVWRIFFFGSSKSRKVLEILCFVFVELFSFKEAAIFFSGPATKMGGGG